MWEQVIAFCVPHCWLAEHRLTTAVNTYFWVLTGNDMATSDNALMSSNSTGGQGEDPNFIARAEEFL